MQVVADVGGIPHGRSTRRIGSDCCNLNIVTPFMEYLHTKKPRTRQG